MAVIHTLAHINIVNIHLTYEFCQWVGRSELLLGLRKINVCKDPISHAKIFPVAFCFLMVPYLDRQTGGI